jgi:mRNA interferase RelE/StbE
VANYEIRIKPSAVKELEALQANDRRRIVARIQNLALEPGPLGCEKLTPQDRFRLRQGSLRILYEVRDRDSTVTVVKIGHRGDVYR